MSDDWLSLLLFLAVARLLKGVEIAVEGVFKWVFSPQLKIGDALGYAYCWKLVQEKLIPAKSYAAPPREWSKPFLDFVEGMDDKLKGPMLIHTTLNGEWRRHGVGGSINADQYDEVLDLIEEVHGWRAPTPSEVDRWR